MPQWSAGLEFKVKHSNWIVLTARTAGQTIFWVHRSPRVKIHIISHSNLCVVVLINTKHWLTVTATTFTLFLFFGSYLNICLFSISSYRSYSLNLFWPNTSTLKHFFLFPGHRYASINLNKTANRKWPPEISYMKEENIASTMLQKLSDVTFSIFLLRMPNTCKNLFANLI